MIDYPAPIPINEVNIYVKLAKKGNIPARQALILRNARLVISLAVQYCKKNHLPNEIRDELIQEGLASIPYAIKMYDLNSSCTFISYVIYWIYDAFMKYRNRTCNLVHVPINVIESERSERLGRDKIKCSLSDIEYYRNMSITNPELVDEHGDATSIFDLIPSKSETKDIDFADYGIKGREAEILSLVYNEDLSFNEVKISFGLSRERIRQIHDSALAKIKYELKPIEEYCGERLIEVQRSKFERKSEELYIKVGRGKFCRKLLKRGSTHSNCWKDSEGNSYQTAYWIPDSQFPAKVLERLFKFVIDQLEEAKLPYIVKMDETTDLWYISFELYSVFITELNHKYYLKIIAGYTDLKDCVFEYNSRDRLRFKRMIKKIISKLR